MTEDNVILLSSFLLVWGILFRYFQKLKKKKKPMIHLIFHVAYSIFFLYGLFYDSVGKGTALVWWAGLILFLWVQGLFLGILLLIDGYKLRKKSKGTSPR